MVKLSLVMRFSEIVEECFPFTAADGQVFVRVPIPPGCILALRSPAFRNWFFYSVYAKLDTIPTVNAFHAILNLLESKASMQVYQRLPVSRRVAYSGSSLIPTEIFFDLGDRYGNYVQIAPTGWKTTQSNYVIFHTSPSALPVPKPDDPGSQSLGLALETLRNSLNLPSRAAWLLCLAWLVSAFRPRGPYPVLILQGPPGSGKSFAARILRTLLDPSTAPLSPIPSSVRDLLLLARHNWVLAFDHVSALPAPVTDALCRLGFGLGATVHETGRATPHPLLQSLRCPVILTVTERWSCPPDLADRAFVVTLPPLPPSSRLSEIALITALEKVWPTLLAALCSAISTALTRLPEMNLPSGTCADALAWAMAASPAFGSSDEEMQQALAPPPPPHPIVEAIRVLVEQRRHWTGTATELLNLLQPAVSCHSPAVLSKQLRSCTLVLADHGIDLKFRRLHEGARMVELRDDLGDTSGDSNPRNAPPLPSPEFQAPPQPAQTEALTS